MNMNMKIQAEPPTHHSTHIHAMTYQAPASYETWITSTSSTTFYIWSSAQHRHCSSACVPLSGILHNSACAARTQHRPVTSAPALTHAQDELVNESVCTFVCVGTAVRGFVSGRNLWIVGQCGAHCIVVRREHGVCLLLRGLGVLRE